MCEPRRQVGGGGVQQRAGVQQPRRVQRLWSGVGIEVHTMKIVACMRACKSWDGTPGLEYGHTANREAQCTTHSQDAHASPVPCASLQHCGTALLRPAAPSAAHPGTACPPRTAGRGEGKRKGGVFGLVTTQSRTQSPIPASLPCSQLVPESFIPEPTCQRCPAPLLPTRAKPAPNLTYPGAAANHHISPTGTHPSPSLSHYPPSPRSLPGSAALPLSPAAPWPP